MGVCGVPTVGFGPGNEVDAHAVTERVAISDLVEAAQFYAAFPLTFVHTVEREAVAKAGAR
jgi:acetylornithine deacetylase/succinyl-diaminopimelate desuccinylase-like protein